MTANRATPAIFELDDNGEATGSVKFYCSEQCATLAPQQIDFDFPRYSDGQSADWIDGTVCETCGRPLDGPVVPPEYQIIPQDTLEAIGRWVLRAAPGGSFLSAVLSNDLREAVGQADEGNQAALTAIVKYIYNRCPGMCWGAPERVRTWSEQGGLEKVAPDEVNL